MVNFIVTYNTHDLNLRNSSSGKIIYNLDHYGEYSNLNCIFSVNSQRLISHNNKTIKIWNLGNGKLETTMQGETEYDFSFLPHKELIALKLPLSFHRHTKYGGWIFSQFFSIKRY